MLSRKDFEAVRSLQEERNQIVHQEAGQLKASDYRRIAEDARKVALLTNWAALLVLYNNKPLLEYVSQGDVEAFGSWPPPLPTQTKFGRRRMQPKAPQREPDADN